MGDHVRKTLRVELLLQTTLFVYCYRSHTTTADTITVQQGHLGTKGTTRLYKRSRNSCRKSRSTTAGEPAFQTCYDCRAAAIIQCFPDRLSTIWQQDLLRLAPNLPLSAAATIAKVLYAASQPRVSLSIEQQLLSASPPTVQVGQPTPRTSIRSAVRYRLQPI